MQEQQPNHKENNGSSQQENIKMKGTTSFQSIQFDHEFQQLQQKQRQQKTYFCFYYEQRQNLAMISISHMNTKKTTHPHKWHLWLFYYHTNANKNFIEKKIDRREKKNRSHTVSGDWL